MAHIIHGDAAKVLQIYEPNTFDSMVTDPPAGIGFMGKDWDKDKGDRDAWIDWLHSIMLEAYLVMKPGAHGLVWALPRTAHWTATALEDAGFEVREKILHLFGSGFPKSLDVGKAIDKLLGAEREVVGSKAGLPGYSLCENLGNGFAMSGNVDYSLRNPEAECAVTAPATELAKKWDGFGTHLKPAVEEWILVRKPLEGTVADNVIDHGCGGLNIDGCRIGTEKRVNQPAANKGGGNSLNMSVVGMPATATATEGRFPANLVLSHHPDCKKKKCVDDCAVKMLDDQSGISKSTPRTPSKNHHYGDVTSFQRGNETSEHSDQGGASRFFYCAKPSKNERGIFNNHPTVKPIKLIRYLARLITPPGGKIVDPFAGSGSIGCAAVLEGFDYVGIEIEEDSYELASERLAKYIKKAESRRYVKRLRKVVR